MGSKAPKAGRKRKKISFAFYSPDAKEVVLMGDFNDWNPKKHVMKKNHDGMWEKFLFLYPGTYEYKFIQDGQWIVDPGNDRQCPNRFGTRNSVIVVSS